MKSTSQTLLKNVLAELAEERSKRIELESRLYNCTCACSKTKNINTLDLDQTIHNLSIVQDIHIEIDEKAKQSKVEKRKGDRQQDMKLKFQHNDDKMRSRSEQQKLIEAQQREIKSLQTERDGLTDLIHALTSNNDAIAHAKMNSENSTIEPQHLERALPLHAIQLLEIMPWDKHAEEFISVAEEVSDRELQQNTQRMVMQFIFLSSLNLID